MFVCLCVDGKRRRAQPAGVDLLLLALLALGDSKGRSRRRSPAPLNTSSDDAKRVPSTLLPQQRIVFHMTKRLD
jgi:hypothetical protein